MKYLKKKSSPQSSVRTNDILIPPEIEGWNWGAFLLSWVWGIGNKVYISLLALIFPFSLIMPFILGFKGNQWAWQKNNWSNIKEFKSLQRKWAFAGFSIIGSLISLFILTSIIYQ